MAKLNYDVKLSLYGMLGALLLVSSVVILLYLLGNFIAPRKKRVRYKEEPYSAGVELPIIRQRYESNIALFALFFLIFDILAFIIIISEGVFYPVLYIVIVLLGMVLVRRNV